MGETEMSCIHELQSIVQEQSVRIAKLEKANPKHTTKPVMVGKRFMMYSCSNCDWEGLTADVYEKHNCEEYPHAK